MEVRSARPPANRAVAALQSASGSITSASPLLTNSLPRGAATPITRYNSFEAVCKAQQKVDENAQLREELLRKLPQPAPRNDMAALGDTVAVRILELLDPMSADAAAFAETCRAVRESLLHASNVEKVVMVPSMVSSAALASEAVQKTLSAFFVARGSEVRTLVIRRADETTIKDKCGEGPSWNVPLLRLPIPWALQLVSHMPYLTELDLRHVQWGEVHASLVLPYFFSDLHVATSGTLRVLKVDAELMQYWTPGWWRRHVNLSSLAVGDRYCSFNDSALNTSPSKQLELPSDYYVLMREECRHWKLELWRPLKPSSVQQLFAPATGVSFAGVEELLVNVRLNERVCDGTERSATVGGGAGGVASNAIGNAEAASAAEASADVRPSTRGRRTLTAADIAGVSVPYPRLNTVTIVDIGDRPEGAAEIYKAVMSLAPELKHFNVCDTVALDAPAAAAEGSKSERGKRSGGAAKHVN